MKMWSQVLRESGEGTIILHDQEEMGSLVGFHWEGGQNGKFY